MVVLSNNDGCVVARSARSKELGMKMGQPWHHVEPRLRDVTTAFSSNYALYADMSNRFATILSLMAPRLEIYSVDECFADLTGIRDIENHAHHIRARVLQWTGLPVCVGIGPTKTQAKLANFIAKKWPRQDGVFDLGAMSASARDALMSAIAVEEVWGVGPRTSASLQSLGIHNVLQLKQANAKWIRSRFSVVVERIVQELNGVACAELDVAPADKQQIRSSRSFGSAVYSLSDLKEALNAFTGIAAEKLRAQSSKAGVLQVFVSTNVFKPQSPQYSRGITWRLPERTNDTRVLIQHGTRLLEALYRPGFEYKRCGVNLMDFAPAHEGQGVLFSSATPSKVSSALDAINAKFGRDSIAIGRVPGKRPWSMQRTRLSKRYTTDPDELMLVR